MKALMNTVGEKETQASNEIVALLQKRGYVITDVYVTRFVYNTGEEFVTVKITNGNALVMPSDKTKKKINKILSRIL